MKAPNLPEILDNKLITSRYTIRRRAFVNPSENRLYTNKSRTKKIRLLLFLADKTVSNNGTGINHWIVWSIITRQGECIEFPTRRLSTNVTMNFIDPNFFTCCTIHEGICARLQTKRFICITIGKLLSINLERGCKKEFHE
jgi:hypothetical protein